MQDVSMKLSEMKLGKKGVIVTVANENYCTKLCAEQGRYGRRHRRRNGVLSEINPERALRHHLLDMGLTPGTIVSVRKVAPLGDPLEITLRGYELTLRKEDAEKIEVEPGMDKMPACTCCAGCGAGHTCSNE
jgi:Fe2+ transport system protein FeoA